MDVLLVRLCRKHGLEEPSSVMDLPDVTSGFEGSDSFAHYWDLLWAIVDLLDCNGRSITSVDHAFVILYRHPDPVFVKDRPGFLYQGVDPVAQAAVKV